MLIQNITSLASHCFILILLSRIMLPLIKKIKLPIIKNKIYSRTPCFLKWLNKNWKQFNKGIWIKSIKKVNNLNKIKWVKKIKRTRRKYIIDKFLFTINKLAIMMGKIYSNPPILINHHLLRIKKTIRLKEKKSN
jgi:hypothetical protein